MSAEEFMTRERALSGRILELIAGDADLRRRFLDDPFGALEGTGVVEEIETLKADWLAENDTSGFGGTFNLAQSPLANSVCALTLSISDRPAATLSQYVNQGTQFRTFGGR